MSCIVPPWSAPQDFTLCSYQKKGGALPPWGTGSLPSRARKSLGLAASPLTCPTTCDQKKFRLESFLKEFQVCTLGVSALRFGVWERDMIEGLWVSGSTSQRIENVEMKICRSSRQDVPAKSLATSPKYRMFQRNFMNAPDSPEIGRALPKSINGLSEISTKLQSFNT